MTLAAATHGDALVGSISDLAADAAGAAEHLLEKATAATRGVIAPDGQVDAALLDLEQHRAHGLAWLATYVQSLKQLAAYASRLEGEGRLGEIERLIVQIGAAEYSAQVAGGIADQPARICPAGRARRLA